jgi:hypothetical protein
VGRALPVHFPSPLAPFRLWPDVACLTSQLTEQDGRPHGYVKAKAEAEEALGWEVEGFSVNPWSWGRENTAEADWMEQWSTRIPSQGRLTMKFLKLEVF